MNKCDIEYLTENREDRKKKNEIPILWDQKVCDFAALVFFKYQKEKANKGPGTLTLKQCLGINTV